MRYDTIPGDVSSGGGEAVEVWLRVLDDAHRSEVRLDNVVQRQHVGGNLRYKTIDRTIAYRPTKNSRQHSRNCHVIYTKQHASRECHVFGVVFRTYEAYFGCCLICVRWFGVRALCGVRQAVLITSQRNHVIM